MSDPKSIKAEKGKKGEQDDSDDIFITSVPGQSNDDDNSDVMETIAESRNRLKKLEEDQASRRQELATYLKDLKESNNTPDDSVQFPEQFDQVVDAMGNREMLMGNDDTFWKTFLVDDIVKPAPNEGADENGESVEKKLVEGMEEIKRLDLLLAEKTREAKRVSTVAASVASPKAGRRANTPNRRRKAAPKKTGDAAEDTIPKDKIKDSSGTEPFVQQNTVSLKPEEEARLARIMGSDDNDNDDEDRHEGEDDGYTPPTAEAHRLETIDSRLRAMAADDAEWEAKSEGLWRPESAMASAFDHEDTFAEPALTNRSAVTSIGDYRPVRKPKPGDDYIDELREARYMKDRLKKINDTLTRLDEAREVSQHEVRTLIVKLKSIVEIEEDEETDE